MNLLYEISKSKKNLDGKQILTHKIFFSLPCVSHILVMIRRIMTEEKHMKKQANIFPLTSLMPFSTSFDLMARISDCELNKAPEHLVVRFLMFFKGLGRRDAMAASLSYTLTMPLYDLNVQNNLTIIILKNSTKMYTSGKQE